MTWFGQNRRDGEDRRSGSDRRVCDDHPNCLYRLDLLEKWQEAINKKIDGFQKLLIANLAGICTLLLSALIAAIVYIAKGTMK